MHFVCHGAVSLIWFLVFFDVDWSLKPVYVMFNCWWSSHHRTGSSTRSLTCCCTRHDSSLIVCSTQSCFWRSWYWRTRLTTVQNLSCANSVWLRHEGLYDTVRAADLWHVDLSSASEVMQTWMFSPDSWWMRTEEPRWDLQHVSKSQRLTHAVLINLETSLLFCSRGVALYIFLNVLRLILKPKGPLLSFLSHGLGLNV